MLYAQCVMIQQRCCNSLRKVRRYEMHHDIKPKCLHTIGDATNMSQNYRAKYSAWQQLLTTNQNRIKLTFAMRHILAASENYDYITETSQKYYQSVWNGVKVQWMTEAKWMRPQTFGVMKTRL